MIYTRNHKVITGIVGGLVIVSGLLWYFQSQGILKIFPTAEDRAIKQALMIDESKFRPAEGLSTEDFQKQIAELYKRRDNVKASPDNAQAWFLFGYQKGFLNDHEGAALAWERAFALQPENFIVTGNLGNVYQYFLKDYGKAEFYYNKALESQPTYTSAYQGLADLYRFNWKEKQNLLEPLLLQAAKNDPRSQITYLGYLVEFFAEKGDIVKAKDYLSKISAIDPVAAQKLRETYPALK